MSAERLRQAAALLRERAGAATPVPWRAFEQHGRDYTDEGYSIIGVKSDEIDVALTYPTGFEHDRHEADAAYIALMAPPVALALADWLEDHAINADYWAQELAANPDSDPMRFVAGDSADRLADAILGDAS